MRHLLCILLLMTSVLCGAVQASYGSDGLTKIADGVYGYIDDGPGTPGNLYAANVGVVVGTQSVLVVDTLTSADEAKRLIEDIRKITDKPIRFVVNTHYHLDHALGNSAFEDIGAMIIAHRLCRENVMATGVQTLANPAAFRLPPDFWNATRLAPPSITFEHEMKLDLGDMPVRLVHTGFASHSPGSSLVILPTRSTVFTGDILFTDIHPYLAEADLAGWDKNLTLLAAMKMTHIVPGHGPLSTTADLMDLQAYLHQFNATARELRATMSDPEAITAEMLKRLPAKKWGEALVGMNIRMRYLESSEGAMK